MGRLFDQSETAVSRVDTCSHSGSSDYMVIHGLRLPLQFSRMVSNSWLLRERGSWGLRVGLDAYGNSLETELGEVYEGEERILQATRSLCRYFQADGYYGEPEKQCDLMPGYIPDITDFTEVVCFGISGDGAPFCFDFRVNREQPSVIWWDDVHWRRIAPDFGTFLQLFGLQERL